MAGTIRAISWNLHGVPYFWKSRKGRMKAAIAACLEHTPDFIGLEEVWSPSDARFIARAAQSANFESLTGLGGWGRASGGLMLLYSSPRWRLTAPPAFHRYDTHASDLKLYEADGVGHKGILLANLGSAATGETISVIVTHLQSQYSHGRTYERVRRLQADQLDTLIQTLPESQLCLVLGDFNTTPEDSAVYEVLTRHCIDLTAEYRAACNRVRGPRCGTAFDSPTRLEWIDYVLAGHSARRLLKSWQIDLIQNIAPDSPYSDHDGLIATVTKAVSDEVKKGDPIENLTNTTHISRRDAIKRITAASLRRPLYFQPSSIG